MHLNIVLLPAHRGIYGKHLYWQEAGPFITPPAQSGIHHVLKSHHVLQWVSENQEYLEVAFLFSTTTNCMWTHPRAAVPLISSTLFCIPVGYDYNSIVISTTSRKAFIEKTWLEDSAPKGLFLIKRKFFSCQRNRSHFTPCKFCYFLQTYQENRIFTKMNYFPLSCEETKTLGRNLFLHCSIKLKYHHLISK